MQTILKTKKFHWLLAAAIPFLSSGTPMDIIQAVKSKLSPQYTNRVVTFSTKNSGSCFKIVRNEEIFTQGWDTLQQPMFWSEIMTLSPKYCVVNQTTEREILGVIPSRKYDSVSVERKSIFKDSVKAHHGFVSASQVTVTGGKSNYYLLRETMPYLGTAIDIFIAEGTDPWYAQTIMLIESPGASRVSPAGAAGHFQLMKEVAISVGLTVNKYTDERHDLVKSAQGAARFMQRVCIPQAKAMLDARGISYQPSDLWFRLLVMHIYHAGAGNVRPALNSFAPSAGGRWMIERLWRTSHGGFQVACQNYSQVAIAALMQLERIYLREGEKICGAEDIYFK
ncbi:MAG: transglycosylase SLT domain-containing protein [Bacteroidia bacterium]